MTVVIIGMVLTNMIFLPSVITGAIRLYEQKTIEYHPMLAASAAVSAKKRVKTVKIPMMTLCAQ